MWLWFPDRLSTPLFENIRFKAPLPEMTPEWFDTPLTVKSKPPTDEIGLLEFVGKVTA